MQKFIKNSQLNRSTLAFPLAMVLFEFALYMANDMTQPAMLLITQEFSVDQSWVALSMTAFIIGGATLSLLAGPLSDRVGRRPVMLVGVAYFVLSCLATYCVHSMEAFIVLRIFQGAALCLIGAVGYAAIQESFEEKPAVKVMALMANVSLLAPLIGPLAGAALVEYAPWRSSFLLIAVLAFVALIGLWRTMPETVDSHLVKASWSNVIHEYRKLFSHSHFVVTAICLPLICTPLVAWIALSPVLLGHDLGLNMLAYGLWQLPVFGSLILGNICVFRLADRWPLGQSALYSVWPILAGSLIALYGLFNPFDTPIFIVAGISLISFAVGLTFSVLYRFTLMCVDLPKGTVSAGMALLMLGVQALGIELIRNAYVIWGINGFTLTIVLFACCFVALSRPLVHQEMVRRLEGQAVATGH